MWWLPVAAVAQEVGELRVQVMDTVDQLPINGVTLQLSSEQLIGGVQEKLADADGEALFTELPPGSYRLVATKPGFRGVTMEGVLVTAGQPTAQKVALDVSIECTYVCLLYLPDPWGMERERGREAVHLERLPIEPGAAPVWSRGQAWSGLPVGMAMRGLTVAGPGERALPMPGLAVQSLALRRGMSSLASPGGQVVTIEPRTDSKSWMHLGGPELHGSARFAHDDDEIPASVAVEATPDLAQGVASAGLMKGNHRLEVFALGSSGQGDDGTLLMDASTFPTYGLRLRAAGLARYWTADDQDATRLSGATSLTWSKNDRGSFDLGAQLERHDEIVRTSLYTEAKIPASKMASLQAGVRGVRETWGDAERRQLAPRAQASLRLPRPLELDVMVAAWADPGMWMPEGVGVELPPSRTLQAMLIRRLEDAGELWGGLRRVDLGEERGDLAVVGGLAWEGRGLTLGLDGAISPAARWSTATLHLSGAHVPPLRTQMGLVSTWRSFGGQAPPDGVALALPSLEAAHLDTGGRVSQPVRLAQHDLVLEGTVWTRLADSSAEDTTFQAVPSLGPVEVAVRLEF